MDKNILSKPRTLIAGLFVVLTLIISPLAMADNCNGNKGSQNIVVHLKRQIEDLQGAITGVRLATLMQSKGCNVTIFLTLGGVRIADDRMPQALAFGVNPMAPTLEQAVSAFQGLGGTIAVCPACAEEIELTEHDLIPGAKIIGPDAIANLFMDADKILDF